MIVYNLVKRTSLFLFFLFYHWFFSDGPYWLKIVVQKNRIVIYQKCLRKFFRDYFFFAQVFDCSFVYSFSMISPGISVYKPNYFGIWLRQQHIFWHFLDLYGTRSRSLFGIFLAIHKNLINDRNWIYDLWIIIFEWRFKTRNSRWKCRLTSATTGIPTAWCGLPFLVSHAASLASDIQGSANLMELYTIL